MQTPFESIKDHLNKIPKDAVKIWKNEGGYLQWEVINCNHNFTAHGDYIFCQQCGKVIQLRTERVGF